MKPASFLILLLSFFIFVSEAEARGCRSCGGFRRGGPIRRWVQARRARRSGRRGQPSRCGSGNCSSGGGNSSGSGGHTGNEGSSSPASSDSQSFGGLDPNASTQQQPPGAAAGGEEEPAAPSLPAETPRTEEKALQKPEQKADVCLETLEKNAKALIASTAIKKEDAEAQTQARTFLELIETARKENAKFDDVESPDRLKYFLEVLIKGDPFRDTESLWRTEGGMYMPQNFQNLVTSLRLYSSAKDTSDKLKVLEDSTSHLGWLTSSYLWPQRGSGFHQHRHLYDRAQSWLACVKKVQASEGNTPATPSTPPPTPQDQKKQPEAPPEVDRVALGQALYQSKCVGCHLSNGIEVSSFTLASKRVGERSMPPKKDAPPLSVEEITNLQAFFATQ